MRPQHIFLGIDGGGSKTRAVAVDEHGREFGRGNAGSSNYRSVGIEAARQELMRAISMAVPDAQLIHRANIGLAGIDVAIDHVVWQPYIGQIAPYVHLTNDAELLLSAFPSGNALALIAGTGSIAYARAAGGEVLRCGGWGHILGDEGSGYSLGIKALQAVMKASDGRRAPTQLLQLTLDHWQLPAIDDLVDFVYGDTCTKATIASLATLVFLAAERDDTAAQELIGETASELIEHVNTLARRSHFAGDVSLALGGSLLLQQQNLREMVLSAIQSHIPVAHVECVQDAALSAALAAARTFAEQ